MARNHVSQVPDVTMKILVDILYSGDAAGKMWKKREKDGLRPFGVRKPSFLVNVIFFPRDLVEADGF